MDIVLGKSVDDVSSNAVVNLAWKEIKPTNTILPGDTIYA